MRPSLDLENVWRQIIERQKNSGLNVKDFCDAEGLKDYSFWYWSRVLTKRDRLAKKQRTKNRSTPAANRGKKEECLPSRKQSDIERRVKRERDFWLALLREWRSSGLGLGSFAASKSVHYRTMLRWKRKLAADIDQPVAQVSCNPGSENNFAPVKLISEESSAPDEKTPGRTVIEIVLQGGRLIRVAPDCPTGFLSAVLAALEEK